MEFPSRTQFVTKAVFSSQFVQGQHNQGIPDDTRVGFRMGEWIRPLRLHFPRERHTRYVRWQLTFTNKGVDYNLPTQ